MDRGMHIGSSPFCVFKHAYSSLDWPKSYDYVNLRHFLRDLKYFYPDIIKMKTIVKYH